MSMDTSSFIRPDDMWRSLGLVSGQTMVHLGCGAGFYLIPAAHIVGKTGQVIGIDILPDMLAEAENRARRSNINTIVRTIRGNIENRNGTTLADEMADWVLVANVLHQSDPASVFAEAQRVLKSAGHIAVIEWDTAATPFGPPPAKRVSKKSIISAAQAQGLDVDKEWQPSPYHYGLLLKKKVWAENLLLQL